MATAVPVQPGPPPGHALDDENLIIFAVTVDRRLLGETLPGLPGSEGTQRLPLGAFCRLLGLSIQVDPGGASGFILEPKRRFCLDLRAGTVLAGERSLPLDPARVAWKDGDLLVEAPLLAQWFPLRLTVNVPGAMLQVEALEELPCQAAWAANRAREEPLCAPPTSCGSIRRKRRRFPRTSWTP